MLNFQTTTYIKYLLATFVCNATPLKTTKTNKKKLTKANM